MATENPPINEEDDLFNFDDMNRGSSKAEVVSAPAPARAPVAAAAAVEVKPVAAPVAAPVKASADHGHVAPAHSPAPAASAAPSPVHAPAPVPVAPKAPAGQLPLVKPVTVKVAEPLPARPAPVSIAAPRSKRPGLLTLGLIALALMVNVGLVGIVWRSMSSADDVPHNLPEHLPLAADPIPPSLPHVAPPVATKPPSPAWENLDIKAPVLGEADVALAAATEEIRRGEYENARSRLFSLLSVLDRFEASTRPNIAARAQLLAADAYREQADALEHRQAADVAASGFLDPEVKHP
ncbi:MAG TPA: hypothetical protein VK843_05290 [Planctomycetota bacterium]|nr:hypothetical protein [Planctomycetota bacterium]